ncbi:hypothetical protein [Microbulbifer variabilis]|uniref:hypothetical protein n=1 Tax=Microbulbifer variabilis TaxID=266805 RepID=UPI0003687BAD|nr:hypothetical protein [Microbulbifer variabilis]
MKAKYQAVLFVLLTLQASIAGATVLADVKINKLYAYDDYSNASAFLALSNNLPECTKGAYIPPKSEKIPHFDSLYSTMLSAFMAGKTVTFQLYIDRIISGRCEIDAIIVEA